MAQRPFAKPSVPVKKRPCKIRADNVHADGDECHGNEDEHADVDLNDTAPTRTITKPFPTREVRCSSSTTFPSVGAVSLTTRTSPGFEEEWKDFDPR